MFLIIVPVYTFCPRHLKILGCCAERIFAPAADINIGSAQLLRVFKDLGSRRVCIVLAVPVLGERERRIPFGG